MLSRLIGYEFKATRRIFLPAYGVILLLSIANAISLSFSGEHFTLPAGLLLTCYILALFGISVLTFAYMISRFYKNLLGDEGYLMFTLPARTSELIWSKCIASTVWTVVTAIVSIISLFCLVFPLVDGETLFAELWSQLGQVISSLLREYGANVIAIPLEWLVLGILSIIASCLHIYACLSIGSLANKHRLGAAFLAYLGFSLARQTIFSVSVAVIDPFVPEGWLDALFSARSTAMQLHLGGLAVLVYLLISCAISYAITQYILSRHLNLQ